MKSRLVIVHRLVQLSIQNGWKSIQRSLNCTVFKFVVKLMIIWSSSVSLFISFVRCSACHRLPSLFQACQSLVFVCLDGFTEHSYCSNKKADEVAAVIKKRFVNFVPNINIRIMWIVWFLCSQDLLYPFRKGAAWSDCFTCNFSAKASYGILPVQCWIEQAAL